MADPLGLVFSGQDATGAAFKAPWTSYDPYRAEVEIGEKRLAAMQKKKELDDKKKKEALESIIASPVKYDPYVDMPNQITSKASDYITNLYATGQLDKIQPTANQIVSFSKSTANMINALADMEKQLKMKAANDPKVITQELDANIDIMRNPHLAPREFYPEIAEMLEQNRQQAKQVQQTNPWMDDELAESYARARTSDQLSARFMTLPKEYTYEEWMPGMLREAKQVMDATQQRILQGSTTRLTKDLTKEEADAIIDRNFMGNALYAGQMRREFAKLNDEERKEAGGDVLSYAKNKYRDALMGKVVLESKPGGVNISVSTGGTGAPVTQQYKQGARTMPAGQVSQAGVAETNLEFPEGGFAFGVPGQQGELDKMNIRTYVSLNKVDVLGNLNPTDSTSPVNFRYQNGVYLPTAKKEISVKLDDGKIIKIRPGTILTKKTIESIKKYNYGKLTKDDIDWQPWAEGTRTYQVGSGTGLETVFAKWNDVAPLYASYSNYKGKDPIVDLAGSPPSVSVFDYYGIKESKTGGGSSSGATRATFNPADF